MTLSGFARLLAGLGLLGLAIALATWRVDGALAAASFGALVGSAMLGTAATVIGRIRRAESRPASAADQVGRGVMIGGLLVFLATVGTCTAAAWEFTKMWRGFRW